jgi:hypothetical protein
MTAHRYAFLLVPALAAWLPAQIPDGHYVYGAFSPQRGQVGIFHSHPRTAGPPTAITNLQGDLPVSGSSCILYRRSDGAILVGERTPTGNSVDVHVIHLDGSAVASDMMISVGTGGPCCGEIPQMGWLPDGRVVVAATDLSGGVLQNYLTNLYGWQGVGIVDPQSGLVTPIDITNGAQIVDVFNGLAVSQDGTTVYLGTYVSSTQGDIWSVPVTGGTATLIATLPSGISNMAFDRNGDLWVATLDASQALYLVSAESGSWNAVPQTNGSLNAIVHEEATGNFAVLSANSGIPPRSVFWMEPNGTEHMLSDPGFGTLSGIAINPDPEPFGVESRGSDYYYWAMPNPGGLPRLGNAGFSLTVESTSPSSAVGVMLFGHAAATSPVVIAGTVTVNLDPASIVLAVPLPASQPWTVAIPIPAIPSIVGVPVFAQALLAEPGPQLVATEGIEFSVL